MINTHINISIDGKEFFWPRNSIALTRDNDTYHVLFLNNPHHYGYGLSIKDLEFVPVVVHSISYKQYCELREALE
jgi:hypothetical protein